MPKCSPIVLEVSNLCVRYGGAITQGGTLINKVPPHRRNMGEVFQSYALFPHISVRKNISYPQSVRGRSRKEEDEKLAELLNLVGLESFADRKPDQPSGGRQKGVAFARALASDPSVLLMDEPLSALDKKLPEEMLIEIRRIHDATGVTTIYVAHDQREALTISNRHGCRTA